MKWTRAPEMETKAAMKIYTRTGDDGTTGLYRGGRVKKSHPLIGAIGSVDELNAAIGVVRAHEVAEEIDRVLYRIQHHLFDVGADLASLRMLDASRAGAEKRESSSKRVPTKLTKPEYAVWLEEQIDASEADLPPLKKFILPGGSKHAAFLHLARAVCRRAEREVSSLDDELDEGDSVGELVVYLNRLADLLFVLARLTNRLAKVDDVTWEADGAGR